MSGFKPISFDDLLSPLSRDKVFILLEVLDPVICEQFEHSVSIAKYLDIRLDTIPNEYEAFLKSGFGVIEKSLTNGNRDWAANTLDFFRQKNLRDAVKAYLFIDQSFIGHSRDGSTAILDVLREIEATTVCMTNC
jgi:hypothetical protein